MGALVWGAWGEEWALDEKVSFNGFTRQIVVNEGVTSIDIRADVYSAWVRWVTRETNIRFLPAMRTSGADPIPGGETGVTLFMINGWKLCYDPNEVAVSGVLYSDDYPTAFWSLDAIKPLFPATVSALVNNAVTVQNVVTGTALTPEQTAQAVWGHNSRVLTDYHEDQVSDAVWQNATAASLIDKVDLAAAILRNKTVTDPDTGLMTIYAEDGVTPVFVAQIFEDVAASQAYRGQGVQRRERLE